jgi:hypothetical protein
MSVNVIALLRDALQALEAARDRLTSRIDAVQAALDDDLPVTTTGSRRGRRPMRAAERAAVSHRMKAYWAERRKAA